MKRPVLLLALSLLFAPALARAADAPLPYTEGGVWVLDFIKVRPGAFDDYMRSLSKTWKPVYDEAKKQKLVLSYKIIEAEHANPSDWDLLLMVEYANMGAFDGLMEKMRSIETRVVGDESAQRQIQTKRLDIREIYGSKIARELFFR